MRGATVTGLDTTGLRDAFGRIVGWVLFALWSGGPLLLAALESGFWMIWAWFAAYVVLLLAMGAAEWQESRAAHGRQRPRWRRPRPGRLDELVQWGFDRFDDVLPVLALCAIVALLVHGCA